MIESPVEPACEPKVKLYWELLLPKVIVSKLIIFWPISEDPKEYVLDEVIGMGIALSGVYIFYNSIERIEFNIKYFSSLFSINLLN